jgi:predicted dehydrogenase
MRLQWGLIGGGESSQIGAAHRIAAHMNNAFELTAAALDIDPARAREYAMRLGVPRERAYGDWRQMCEAERKRTDRVDLVTIATPNSSHFEITTAFLERACSSGFGTRRRRLGETFNCSEPGVSERRLTFH